jgi:hypothetical protein
MAHESFEDPETAALMNRLFVCVKDDREERPDLDGIYLPRRQGSGRSRGSRNRAGRISSRLGRLRRRTR